MRILSWNVQYGKSVNNHFDIMRMLDYLKSLGEFDVICLQELARHMKDYCIQGQEDQLQLAQHYFENYTPVWGSGFNWASVSSNRLQRQEFGNLTLIKSDPLDYKVHQLPLPATRGNKQMQRVAVETITESDIGPLSIINTHLAFHDSNENRLQLERFSLLEQERIAHHSSPKQLDTGIYQEGYLAKARILCGDFNLTPESANYQYQIQANWIDAWRQRHSDQEHLPTCGIFDSSQWPEGAHCRDYFWLSKELASCNIDVNVDTRTDLSDHQPIILEINV